VIKTLADVGGGGAGGGAVNGKRMVSVASGPCNNESTTIASVFVDAVDGGGGGSSGGTAPGGGYLIVPLSLRATTHLASDGRVMVVTAHSSTPVLFNEIELTSEQFGAAVVAEVRLYMHGCSLLKPLYAWVLPLEAFMCMGAPS
jgi:hypothetical protein